MRKECKARAVLAIRRTAEGDHINVLAWSHERVMTIRHLPGGSFGGGRAVAARDQGDLMQAESSRRVLTWPHV